MSVASMRVLALSAAFAAAACSSNSGMQPAQLSPPQTQAAHAFSTSCKNPPGYEFYGQCVAFTLTKAGGTATVPANKGYTFAYVFPPNDIPKSMALAIGDATIKQIGADPQGQAFPPYTGAGKTFLYAVAYAPQTTKEFAVKGNTQLIVTSTSPLGKTCSAASLTTKWEALPEKVKVTKNKLTITLKLAATNIQEGKAYLAFACK
jgi:hypothetical protein